MAGNPAADPAEDEDLDAASRVTEADVAAAARLWRRLAPEGFRGLINARERRAPGGRTAEASSALVPLGTIRATSPGLTLVPLTAIEAKGGGSKSGKSKPRKSKGGSAPGRKPFDESKHKRDRGRFADKPGAGDDAPKKGRLAGTRKALPKPADRPASPGSKVDKPEHDHATEREHQIARALGGRQVGRRNGKDLPMDALVRDGKDRHGIEIKTMPKGNKDGPTIHADALLRKADYVTRRPGRTVHLVVIDDRKQYGGGQFSAGYSGHQIYYKRGITTSGLGKMHKVKDLAELNRLVRMKEADLPDAAKPSKGWPPDAAARTKLEASAKKDHEGRLRRQQRARAEGRAWKRPPKSKADQST